MRGVTLLEIMLVLSLVCMIGACGLMTHFDAYRASTLESERDQLVTLLRRARALSLDGVCTTACSGAHAHGLRYDSASRAYVMFEGDSYTARYIAADAAFTASRGVGFAGAAEVVFSARAATTSGASMTLTGPSGRSSTIHVGTEGEIMTDE